MIRERVFLASMAHVQCRITRCRELKLTYDIRSVKESMRSRCLDKISRHKRALAFDDDSMGKN